MYINVEQAKNYYKNQPNFKEIYGKISEKTFIILSHMRKKKRFTPPTPYIDY